jgi:FHA domain/zinc-ribbon domain
MPLPVATLEPEITSPPPHNKVVGTISCPSCKTEVLADASFCGNCGYDLRSAENASPAQALPESSLTNPHPIPLGLSPENSGGDSAEELEVEPEMEAEIELEMTLPPEPALPLGINKTQLQQVSAHLFHVQTESKIEILPNLLIVHIGKPNNLIPPDIDLSGFPDSDIVSRVHGDIRNDGDAYYFEDTGSSNGTYINNVPLPPGNRHRLRAGDRIALGKGDKVSFIFQITS